MNRNYRVVWNAAQGIWQVVSELAARTGKSRNRKVSQVVPAAILAAVVVGASPAFGTCASAGSTVSCSGSANPLQPNYTNSADNLNVTVNPGASLGVILPAGGTSMSLTGSNITLTNNGTIDPATLGTPGIVSSGAVIGNASASTQTITNNGILAGSSGTSLDLTGMALAVQNGAGGGVTSITNTGTISGTALPGATLVGADAGVVAAYGGAQVNMSNSGTITGRVAFDSSVGGNTFTNAGTVNGSVSMGANSTNQFIATTDSSVNAAGGTAAATNVVFGTSTLNFAATGYVDGGAGGDNTLHLEQGNASSGAINLAYYLNFNHLDIAGGAWTLSGASTVADATIEGGATAIVNNSASLGTGTITANNGAIQSAASGLTVSNNIAIAAGGLGVTGNLDLALSGTISGSGSLTKSGGGTLTLSGVNTYTGGTTITGGTLAVTGTGTAGAPFSAVTVGSGAALDVQNTLPNFVTLSGGTLETTTGSGVVNGPVALFGTSTFAAGSGSVLTVNGNMSGSGLNVSGTGTIVLTGVNTYGGITLIGGGTLQGNTTSLQGTFTDNSTLVFNQAGNGVFSGSIVGTGALVKQNAGTLTFNTTQSYNGGTAVTGGTLAVVGGGTAGAPGGMVTVGSGAALDLQNALYNEVTLAGGTLETTIGNGVVDGPVTLNGNSTFTTGARAVLTVAGIVSGSTPSTGLNVSGTGTVVLTGQNNYSGGTVITGGTLALGTGGSLAAGGMVDLAAAGVGFSIGSASASQTIGELTGVAGSAISLGGSTLTFGGSGNQTFAGTIGGAGGLIKQGSGVQTLSGANTYSGGTALNGGGLVLGTNAALGTGTLTVGATATLDSSATMALSNAVALNAGLTVSGSNDLTLDGAISGTGGLTKNGATTLALTGANTYSGGTQVNAGTLALESDLAAGTGAITLENGTTLALADGLHVSNDLVIHGATTLEVASGTATESGTLSGSGSYVIGGAGTLLLTGDNSALTGAVSLSGATLTLGDNNAIGNASLSLTGSAGVNYVSGTTITNAISVANGATLDANVAAGSSATQSGMLSGAGALDKSGTGTLTLTNANTYTGATTISAGALLLSGAGSIAQSSGVADNGTLDIAATTAGTSITSLTGSGTVALGAQTLTLTNASGTFSGAIGGTGGLSVSGGTATLSGANTYTGNTTIAGGSTLALSGAGSIAQSADVINNGTLDVSGTSGSATVQNLTGTGSVNIGAQNLTLANASGTFSGAIGGTGGLSVSGGTATLSGTNTYTGNTTIAGGSMLALSGAGSIAQSADVINDGTLDVSGTSGGATVQNLTGTGSVNIGTQTLTLANASGTFSGAFAGSGRIVKAGSGSFVINGNSSSFSGTTELDAGLLEVGDIDHPQATLGGNVLVNVNATLRGHGTVLGDVSDDGTVAPGGSIGTLSVGGNYTQAATATLSIEVSPTAASQLNVSGRATLNGVLAITYDPGTYSATRYTIVSAANGVNGEFTSTTTTLESGANLGSLKSSLVYDANSVSLVLADPTGSANAPVVVAPTDTSIYAALGTAAVLNAQGTTAALLDRTALPGGATTGAPNGWVTATGTQTKVGGSSGEPGFRANQYGFLAGLEESVGDYALGIAGGYTHSDLDEQTTGDSGTIDSLRAALYVSRWLGPVGVSGTAGYGVDFLSQKRPFEGVGTAEGDHMGQEFTAAAQASLPLALGGFTLTPRVGLRFAYFHANGFGESGAAGQDLSVGTDNVRSLQPYVDISLDKTFGDALRPVNAQVRLGYAHEVLDANRALSVGSQDGTLFTAPGTSLPRGYLSMGVTLGMQPAKNLTISLGYDALINTTHASAQAGSLKANYRF
ncbi:hypothetical protein LMG27952_07658 [Paraburkholderia hiiakae]|uniref:Autotransporter domain-containing protein n=1 Tax=Paraburkholderia hiiakae TaxID=1081782 RepID=A0ABM8PBN6_9BURK|nr:autotransporter-associated beta strand repeat-containing protein [Paraburkholderia hiiakae]CAD6562021.1 hypothetical protein LMG27952_07658 [Paraburkholderia hiiakae]